MNGMSLPQGGAHRRAPGAKATGMKLAGWLAAWLILGLGGCNPSPGDNSATQAVARTHAQDGGAPSTTEGATRAAAPAPDPYGLAGKTTRELDQLLAGVEPAGKSYYDLSPEDRAYFDALVAARRHRLGKGPVVTKPDLSKAFPGDYADPDKAPKPLGQPPGSDLRNAGGQP